MIKLRAFEAGRGIWLGAFLALMALPAALLAAPAAHAGNINVVMSVTLNAAPRDVWDFIGGFDRLQDWHPVVESSTVDGPATTPGTVRTLHLKGGGEIKEQLTGYNDVGERYTYRILESPLPVTHYESFLAVTPTGKGDALVIWGSTFDAAPGTPDAKAKKVIQGVYQAGFDNLKKKYGSPKMMK